MPSLTPSVSLHFMRALVSALPRLGQAVPARATAWLAAHPEATRVPLPVQDQVWEDCCAASGDPLLGLRLGLETQPGHLDIVGLLLMSGDTLGDAMELLVDYQQIVGEGGEFSLEKASMGWTLRYAPQFATRSRERTEAVFATLLRLGRWIVGQPLVPLELRFQHRPAADVRDYAQLLDCQVAFETRDNALVLSHAQVAQPLIQSNAIASAHLRALADQMLASLNQQSTAARVQALLQQQPTASRDEIAAQLAMSGRHLNRLLADDNTSFKLLQDTVRRQHAEAALRGGQMRMAEIAEALGFSDESAFAKAFRRWCGESPAQFRARHAE
ncbi:MAG: AraC family transcriptional regulator [Moraxellaceae bacterium]